MGRIAAIFRRFAVKRSLYFFVAQDVALGDRFAKKNRTRLFFRALLRSRRIASRKSGYSGPADGIST